MASRGARDLGEGPQAIEDEHLVAALRARSRAILLKSLLLAAVLTSAVYFWPTP